MALTATICHVDLTTSRIETKILPEDVYRKYPGGSALAGYLLLFTPLQGKGPIAGVALGAGEFEQARAAFYRLAGCDPGRDIRRAPSSDLGLGWLADQIPARTR